MAVITLRTVCHLLASAVLFGCSSSEPSAPTGGCVSNCTPPPPPPPPPLEGIWSTAAPLGTARREMPAALVVDRIYVAGGFGDDREVLSTMAVYDPQSDQWSTAPPMPGARHHHGSVGAGAKLYVVGGYSTLGANWTTQSTLFEFDPATQEWTTRAPLPHPLGAMAVASVGGKVYVFGGASGGAERNHTLIYDPATDAWSAGASMPTAREHVGAAVIGGVIYVAGGRTLSGLNTAALQAYDPATNTWEVRASMRVPRSGHGTAAMDGKLYVFGGENLQDGTVIGAVEEYDPQSNSWLDRRSLPLPLTGPGVAVFGSQIHLFGGSDPSGATRAEQRIFQMP